MLCILKFCENAEWHIKKTPSERKQIWHEPKKAKLHVSPKKADDISFEIMEYNVRKRKRGNLCYDPRPEIKRESPSKWTNFINKVVNFCYWKNKHLGISGSLEVACMYGVVNDHDYIEVPLHHQFILNQISVSTCISFRVYGKK